MKKKSKLFRLGVVFAFCCAVIALLEVFDLHPQFSIGRFSSTWIGVRHMGFVSGPSFTQGLGGAKSVWGHCYEAGLVQIIIQND